MIETKEWYQTLKNFIAFLRNEKKEEPKLNIIDQANLALEKVKEFPSLKKFES